MYIKKYRPGLCVYKKGAEAVVARLREAGAQTEELPANPLPRKEGKG